MIRYKTIDISASSSGETLKDALAGLGEKKRKIRMLHYCLDSNNPVDNIVKEHHIRAYKNQDQIVDYDIGSFEYAIYSNYAVLTNPKPIPVDIMLERGDGFKVGLYDSSSTPVGNIMIEYEDLGE